MRFILGLVIGFGIGFGGAVLLAPEKKKPAPARSSAEPPTFAGKNGSGSLRSVMDTVKERLSEAMSEAKAAKKQAEAEMEQRYKDTLARISAESKDD